MAIIEMNPVNPIRWVGRVVTCFVSLKELAVFLDLSLSEPEASSELLPVDEVVVVVVVVAVAVVAVVAAAALPAEVLVAVAEAAVAPAEACGVGGGGGGGGGGGFLLRFSRSLPTEAAATPARSFRLPPRPTGSLISGSGVPADAKPLAAGSVLTGSEETGSVEAIALFRRIFPGPGLLRSDGGSSLI